ncbi:MAG: hypothetical protein PHN82_02950 [bacterium]|nr:hypothetical protein [bacterium]
MAGGPAPALLVFLLVCTVYAATLTKDHSYDTIAYATAVEKGGEDLFHPHHLLSNAVFRAGYSLLAALGYRGRALLPMQMMSAFFGALAAGLFCLLLARLSCSPIIAAAGSLLLAFSYGFWFISMQGEAYSIIATLFIAILWVVSGYFRLPSARAAFLVGALAGSVGLFHQCGVFIIPIFWCMYPFVRGRAGKALRTHFLPPLAGFLLTTALPYLLIARFFLEIRTPGEFLYWLTSYLHTKPAFTAQGDWTTVSLSLAWWGKSVVNAGAFNQARVHAVGCGGILAVLLLLSLSLRRSYAEMREMTVFCLVWIVAYFAFFTWWTPRGTKFWIITSIPLLLLAALACERLVRGARGRGVRAALLALAAAAPVAVFSLNLGIDIAGSARRENNLALVAAEKIHDETEEDALIIAGSGMVARYLRYVHLREETVWPFGLFEGRDREEFERLAGGLADTIEAALGEGRAVYMTSDLFSPPPAKLAFYRIDPGRFEAFWRPYRPRTAAAAPFHFENEEGVIVEKRLLRIGRDRRESLLEDPLPRDDEHLFADDGV